MWGRRSAYVVRVGGIYRQNGYVKDLTSYQPENHFKVFSISLKFFITANVWENVKCICLNYLIFKSRELNFALRKLQLDTIHNENAFKWLPFKYYTSILGMGGLEFANMILALAHYLTQVTINSDDGIPLRIMIKSIWTLIVTKYMITCKGCILVLVISTWSSRLEIDFLCSDTSWAQSSWPPSCSAPLAEGDAGLPCWNINLISHYNFSYPFVYKLSKPQLNHNST